MAGMIGKKKVLALQVLLAVLFAIAIQASPQWRRYRLMKQAVPIQRQLDIFRLQHGHYPASLSEGKIAEPDEVFYQSQADGSYILWYGTTLGESIVFHSNRQRWE
jgi:hypothetical protein